MGRCALSRSQDSKKRHVGRDFLQSLLQTGSACSGFARLARRAIAVGKIGAP
jgi:hypothetical protein